MPEDPVQRLRQIDETIWEHHAHIGPGDEVLFWREYTSSRNYGFSATNQFIGNLKKVPGRAGAGEMRHKANAIREASTYLSQVLNPEWLKAATLVPVPCSKAQGHAEYDDRMVQVCRGIQCGHPIDVRELVFTDQSMTAAHLRGPGERRPSVADLVNAYTINETIAARRPQVIGVIDDVITAGTHFKAMKTVLQRRYPDVSVLGIFLARRIFPPAEAADGDNQF